VSGSSTHPSAAQTAALNPMVPQQAKDKLYITLFLFAMVGGLWLSLMSAGYLLAFNINTLMITAIIFTVCSTNWIMRAKPVEEQIGYTALCVVPITLRAVLNMPLFGSWTASQTGQQFAFMGQVAALWALVSCSEEAFRATMMNLAMVFYRSRDREVNAWWQSLFAVTTWMVFHFVQRPFDPIAYKWYIVWLFASGLVMTYVLRKAGLGAAAVTHMLVNLTA